MRVATGIETLITKKNTCKTRSGVPELTRTSDQGRASIEKDHFPKVHPPVSPPSSLIKMPDPTLSIPVPSEDPKPKKKEQSESNDAKQKQKGEKEPEDLVCLASVPRPHDQ
jgi:hypothetical protein